MKTDRGFGWTDGEDGFSNSSDKFEELVRAVKQLNLDSAHALIQGNSDSVARLIVAQLAHVHGMEPTGQRSKETACPTVKFMITPECLQGIIDMVPSHLLTLSVSSVEPLSTHEVRIKKSGVDGALHVEVFDHAVTQPECACRPTA